MEIRSVEHHNSSYLLQVCCASEVIILLTLRGRVAPSSHTGPPTKEGRACHWGKHRSIISSTGQAHATSLDQHLEPNDKLMLAKNGSNKMRLPVYTISWMPGATIDGVSTGDESYNIQWSI